MDGGDEAKGGLASLLNFDPSTFEDAKEFKAHFDKIATAILDDHILVVNQTKHFQIAEIEFYMKGPEAHNDTFTHGDSL
jgi:hypothetical protein